MHVPVDRASRATTDAEMDTFDDGLLKALGELRHLRDQLRSGADERVPESLRASPQTLPSRSAPGAEEEEAAETEYPFSLHGGASLPTAWPIIDQGATMHSNSNHRETIHVP